MRSLTAWVQLVGQQAVTSSDDLLLHFHFLQDSGHIRSTSRTKEQNSHLPNMQIHWNWEEQALDPSQHNGKTDRQALRRYN